MNMALRTIPISTPNLNILEIGAKNLEERMDTTIVKYTLENPHPGYGKDPNIINEYGHTVYPKWITLPNGERVVANSPAHEAELSGKPVEQPKVPEAKPNPWG